MLKSIQNYSFLDKVAITIASTDKSMDGNYSKTTSYLLAEDLEMIAFVFAARKRKNCFPNKFCKCDSDNENHQDDMGTV